MDREQVVSILETLAENAEPAVVEALTIAVDSVKGAAPKARPASAGARWTAEEDEALCREHETGMPVAEMMRAHDRSRGSITSRLVKLGRLDAEAIPLRHRPQSAITERAPDSPAAADRSR